MGSKKSSLKDHQRVQLVLVYHEPSLLLSVLEKQLERSVPLSINTSGESSPEDRPVARLQERMGEMPTGSVYEESSEVNPLAISKANS